MIQHFDLAVWRLSDIRRERASQTMLTASGLLCMSPPSSSTDTIMIFS